MRIKHQDNQDSQDNQDYEEGRRKKEERRKKGFGFSTPNVENSNIRFPSWNLVYLLLTWRIVL